MRSFKEGFERGHMQQCPQGHQMKWAGHSAFGRNAHIGQCFPPRKKAMLWTQQKWQTAPASVDTGQKRTHYAFRRGELTQLLPTDGRKLKCRINKTRPFIFQKRIKVKLCMWNLPIFLVSVCSFIEIKFSYPVFLNRIWPTSHWFGTYYQE